MLIKIRSLLSSLCLPIILISVLVLSLFFGDLVPYELKSQFLSVSLLIKAILIFVLPFIIFFLVFDSVRSFEKGAVKVAFLLLILVCISNVLSSVVAQLAGTSALDFGLIAMKQYATNSTTTNLEPAWKVPLLPLFSNSLALVMGFIASVATSFITNVKINDFVDEFSSFCLKSSFFFLRKMFIPVVPLFILGFALKMQNDNMLSLIFQNYLPVLLFFITSAALYVLFMYGIATSFQLKSWLISVSNMLPAFVTAFSTMSSLATMPFTLAATEKNTDKDVANISIPTTVNIHLIGDCFAVMILVSAVISSFKVDLNLQDYLHFFLYFMLAKFAIATVPGGGIIVVLPLLEQYLKFSPTMMSIMTVLYIIFDPFITVINVMGNGAFAMIFARIYKKIKNINWHVHSIN